MRGRTRAIVTTSLASIIARTASLASQVIAGTLLTSDQFGAYAISLGVIGVTGVMRTGGFSLFAFSIGGLEYRARIRDAYRWGLVAATVGSALTFALLLLTPILRDYYAALGDPAVVQCLYVLMFAQATQPFAILARGNLAAQHRFTILAKIDTVISVSRVLLTLLLGLLGGGALALAVPYAAAFGLQLILCSKAGGLGLRDYWPSGGSLRRATRVMWWPLAASVLITLHGESSFFVFSWFVPTSVMGGFYFAYQLSNQPGMMLAGSLQSVLAPLIVTVRGDRDAERSEILALLRLSLLLVPLLTMAVATAFPPLERLVWSGKWAYLSTPVFVLAIGMSFATVSQLMAGPLIGLQRFKAFAAFELVRSAACLGGAIIGGSLAAMAYDTHQLLLVSSGVSVALACTGILQLLWVTQRFGIALQDVIVSICLGPGLGIGVSTLFEFAWPGAAAFVNLDAPMTALFSVLDLVLVATVYTATLVVMLRFAAPRIAVLLAARAPNALRPLLLTVLVGHRLTSTPDAGGRGDNI
ncbi:MAG: hypothetical protein RJB01_218 [Actinomycetota bacterium]